MSFLKNIITSTLNFLSPVSNSQTTSRTQPSSIQSVRQLSKRSAPAGFDRDHESTQQGVKMKRRKKSQGPDKKSRTRSPGIDQRPVNGEHTAVNGILPNAEDLPSTSFPSPLVQTKSDTDQARMPPPSTPRLTEKTRRKSQIVSRKSLDHNDIASQATRSTRFARSEINDEYDMEEARRRAAATQLPPNSGIWETGEQELFFHLSYRGFEPLLPYSWMIDFPTLPISIFAQQDDDVPLIEPHRSTPFRATKALEELLLTGSKIRDHNISTQDLRSEPILEKATKRYITWASQDLGLPVKSSVKQSDIPVHAIATMRPDQTTHDVLRSLAISMHTLADQHRKAMDIYSSIETSHNLTPPRSEREETTIHHEHGNNGLPVIYGIAICRSIMTLFTLNCHTSLPTFVDKHLKMFSTDHMGKDDKDISQIDSNDKATYVRPSEEDEDLGLRYIAAFDFSDAARDVWNSFVIAIVAMQLRKTMVQVLRARARLPDHDSQQAEDLADESWISNINGTDELEGKEINGDEEDPDA